MTKSICTDCRFAEWFPEIDDDKLGYCGWFLEDRVLPAAVVNVEKDLINYKNGHTTCPTYERKEG